VIALAIVSVHNLFAVVMLSSIFSLLIAGLFVTLDAVDVAFTEAAVGAGVTTVLMLSTLALTATREKIHVRTPLMPLIIVAATGGLLIYGTFDMPLFGDAAAPVHSHVAPRYITESPVEIGVPNMVTSVLASYRGYDTLGELTVIFTAGVGVLLLLARRRRTKAERAADSKTADSKTADIKAESGAKKDGSAGA
jgi:multicomponent Na+:H+ antiporter subunit B